MTTKPLLLRPITSLSRSRPRSSPRLYHSYDRPASPLTTLFPAASLSILRAATPYIPSHGFTLASLSSGARDAGYVDAATNLFPAGAFSLVHYHLVAQRLQLGERARSIIEEEGRMGVGAKVKALTWERLMANRDIIERWQEALSLSAIPTNVSTTLSELASLSDEIWFLAGDVSVDSSWYTKRASLSLIYSSTELFMTTDTSPDFADTREFLDRRFRDVQVVGSAVGGVGQWAGFMARSSVNLLRSKGVRI